MVTIELRCIRHKFGEIEDDVLIAYCRRCSKARGETVLHRWDARTWERLDRDEQDQEHESDLKAA